MTNSSGNNNPFGSTNVAPQPGGDAGLYGASGTPIAPFQVRIHKVAIPLPTNEPEKLVQGMVVQTPQGPSLQMTPATQVLWLETALGFDQRDAFISEVANRINRLQSALMLLLEHTWKTPAGKSPEFQVVLKQVSEYVGATPPDLAKDPVPAFAGEALEFSDPSATVLSDDLYASYREWCLGKGAQEAQIYDAATFRAKMVQTGFTLQPVPRGLAFMGIALKTASPEAKQ